jgi:hypothetical protein
LSGLIQEKSLSALGSVPVAAPATKADELLESDGIDGSLHIMESVVNFRLKRSLTHHAIFPNGFEDATVFVATNGAKSGGLSDADKTAINAIAAEILSAAWDANCDARNPVATEKLRAAGREIVAASPQLIAAANTIQGAESAGVAGPQAMMKLYGATYRTRATTWKTHRGRSATSRFSGRENDPSFCGVENPPLGQDRHGPVSAVDGGAYLRRSDRAADHRRADPWRQ